MLVVLHIVAGLLGIAAGATTLVAGKGSRLHVKVGLVFVVTMLVMTSSGLVLSVTRPNAFSALNGIAASLTFYLVTTGFLTIRRSASRNRWVDVTTAVLALAIAATGIAFGLTGGQRNGPPSPAYFVFAAVAALASAGDFAQAIHGMHGRRLIARHLWRLGAALWIATASFFLGQARVFPEVLRKPALLAVPVLLVLTAVIYWYVRTRWTRRFIDHKTRRSLAQARKPHILQ